MNQVNKNLFSLKDIVKICDVKKVHVSDENKLFDYLRVVCIDKKYENDAENLLFFPIYFTDYDLDDGWVINHIDLRNKIAEIMEKNPNYTFVVEEDMLNSFDNEKYEYIVVKDILGAIHKLYEYQLNKVNPKVVAVTGSVGKTTSVGLIESVLAKKYNVLRIYHKRITPLLLKASIINFLTEEVEYVTLEMSIYFKDHVRVLSNLLRPTIGCFLQLDSSHLHKDGMDRIEDLAIYKSYIFKYASLGFYNDQDDYIKRISLKDNELYFDNEALFKSKMEELLSFVDNVTIEEDGFKIDGNFVKPYLLTELSMLQYALAYRVGKYVGVETQDIIDALNSYVPVENRITKCNIFGKEVFFDGDVTTYERMKQLSKNKYDKSILVIRKFGSAENVDRFEKVVEYFDKFDTVYLFDDIEYLELLKNESNVKIVNNHDFLSNYDGIIFYHYSGYFRDYEEVKDENLFDIKNDGYKIIPYKGE